MGMFDRIWFRCPNCEELIEEQSKAGDCILKDYSPKAVPTAIAADIESNKVFCEQCRRHWVIRVKIPKDFVQMELVSDPEFQQKDDPYP